MALSSRLPQKHSCVLQKSDDYKPDLNVADVGSRASCQ